VEELDSDDTDTQGADLSRSGNRRFISDSLQFTGVDLSRDGRQRRVYAYSEDDESTDEDTEVSSGRDSEGQDDGASHEMEDALVQSALSRIRRAKEKGKQDVKLSKEELKALERRRKRLEKEAKDRQRQASSGSERRRRKEQRVAVPLSQFDAPPSRKTRTGAKSDDTLPRHPSPAMGSNNQSRTPPMGLFPPPSGSRSRPRSATSSSHRHSDNSSPFEYNYINTPPTHRQASDSSTRSSPSRLPYPQDDVEWRPASSSSRDTRDVRDPFQYQTAGPRAPAYLSGAAAARRNVSGSQGVAYVSMPRGTVPAAARDNASSEETTEEGDGDTTSDEVGNGAHISRSRIVPPTDAAIVVEEGSPSPEPERPKSKRSSSRASPVKRKPVSGNGGGRRRKKS
jgi:PRA1 family protein 1